MKRSDKTGKFQKNNDLAKKNRRNIVAISSVLLAIIIIGVIYAYFSDTVKVTSDIKAGIVSVRLDEDAPFDDTSDIPEEGVTASEKIFRAVSEGNIDSYVRAKIIPIIEYFDIEEDAWITANVPASDIELEITAPEWVESNGYYYYKNILLAGNSSDDVVATIVNVNIPDNLKAEQIRLTIKVILEATQYGYSAWKNIFNIDKLPDGVEYWHNENKTRENMVVWLDAARINGNNGDEITTWEDLTGNGNNAVKSPDEPVISSPNLETNAINGLSAIRFTDTDNGGDKNTGMDLPPINQYFTQNEAEMFIVCDIIENSGPMNRIFYTYR